MPLRCSLSSGLEFGRSVPSWRRISYCCDVNCARHSASVFSTSNFSAASAGPTRNQRNAARPNRLATDASRIRRSIMLVSVAEAKSDIRWEIRRLGVEVTPDCDDFSALSQLRRQYLVTGHLVPLREQSGQEWSCFCGGSTATESTVTGSTVTGSAVNGSTATGSGAIGGRASCRLGRTGPGNGRDPAAAVPEP